MFSDFFFEVRRALQPHHTRYPAYIGHTVYQSEYDALKTECDRAHQLNAAQAHEIDLLVTKEGELWAELREARTDAAVWRSKYEDLSTEVKKPAPRRKKVQDAS